MLRLCSFLLVAITVFATGCSTVPAGPSVAVFPGPGKSFEVFQQEDIICRRWAQQQAGTSPGETANQQVAGGALLGGAVGAGLGAAIGAATGDVGAGAAIGGATGVVGGAGMGSNRAYAAEWQLQRTYDIAYQQCMYAKGNQIPGGPPAVYHNPAYSVPSRGPSSPPAPSGSSQGGSYVVVPGQYVNGRWIPAHKVFVPKGAQP